MERHWHDLRKALVSSASVQHHDPFTATSRPPPATERKKANATVQRSKNDSRWQPARCHVPLAALLSTTGGCPGPSTASRGEDRERNREHKFKRTKTTNFQAASLALWLPSDVATRCQPLTSKAASEATESLQRRGPPHPSTADSREAACQAAGARQAAAHGATEPCRTPSLRAHGCKSSSRSLTKRPNTDQPKPQQAAAQQASENLPLGSVPETSSPVACRVSAQPSRKRHAEVPCQEPQHSRTPKRRRTSELLSY